MPIKIEYAPVGALLGLAQAAGVGQRQQRGAELDLAFVGMSLAAQARNAQIAAGIQAQDQAFALQTAAAARMARTPTRVQPTDSVLGRMQWRESQQEFRQEQEQKVQLEQLQKMFEAGDITERQRRQAEMGIEKGDMALVRRTLFPKEPKFDKELSTVAVVRYTEKRTQRHIEREIAKEERKLKIDPYADAVKEKARVDAAEKKIAQLEIALKASWAREDAALGLRAAPVQIKQITSAEEDALMDKYLAETKGDVEAAKRLLAERSGQ